MVKKKSTLNDLSTSALATLSAKNSLNFINSNSSIMQSTVLMPFLDTMQEPDYSEWINFDFWKCEDFAALLAGINPDEIPKLAKRMNESTSTFYYSKVKSFKRLLNRLQRSTLFTNLERQAIPQKCLEWAFEKEISVSNELNKYIISIGLKKEVNTSTTKIEKTSSQTHKKTNLIKILHSLLKIAYKTEFNETKSIKSALNKTIKALAEEEETRHKDTVEKFISWVYFYVNDGKCIGKKKKHENFKKSYLKKGLNQKEIESIYKIMLAAIMTFYKIDCDKNTLNKNMTTITNSIKNHYEDMDQNFIISTINDVFESKSRS